MTQQRQRITTTRCVGFSSPTANFSERCSDFEKTAVPEMSSMHANAPSSSSMKCTYPPHSKKPSKQRKRGKRNKPTRSSLLFLRSSPPSLRLGRCCRHRGSLHLSNAVVAKMVKGKSKDAGNDVRIGWKDPMELKAFCDLCAAQVLEGKGNGEFLRKEGVDAVIKQLGEMGKVVSFLQFKNKWDHLRKQWKTWKQLFESEIGLGYDPNTGRIEATNEWWTRKLEACPKASTIRHKGLPNVGTMEIMFEGSAATGKYAWALSGEIPKACTAGSRDSNDSKEFVDSQCQPFADVDPMKVEGPSLSRAGPAVDKGKGLTSGVHLFKGIHKKPRKKHSIVQEMSDSLKNISDFIVESRSLSTRTPFASTAAAEVQAIMDMVLSLFGVQPGDRLHMFSSFFFMENQKAMNMFAALSHQKEIQLKWLEKQYQLHPELHL